jgi:sec-independent protein translocase protein TatB
MFEIGWSELLVIAVVAVVVIGPKDLPRVLRGVGQWTSRMKRMAREFQNQFNEALREAELEDVRKDVEAIGRDLRGQVEATGNSIKQEMNVALPASSTPAPDMATPPATVEPAAEKPASQLEIASSVMTNPPPAPAPSAEPIAEAKS